MNVFHLSLLTMPSLHETAGSKIKEDLFSWESIYPELQPQPVLKTLTALWNKNDACAFNNHHTLDLKDRNQKKYVNFPSISLPPPPFKLDDVEHELETTTILEDMVEIPKSFISHIENGATTCSNEISAINITNTCVFPDLIPESFENIQLMRKNESIDSDLSYECKNLTIQKVETLFLIIVFISSMTLLYLLPKVEI